MSSKKRQASEAYKQVSLNTYLTAIKYLIVRIKPKKILTALAFLLNKKLICLLFSLFCLYPQITTALVAEDYYWEIGATGGAKSFPSPEAACDHYYNEMRASSSNDLFDWQRFPITYITSSFNVGCHVVCGEPCATQQNLQITGLPAYATPYKYTMDTPDGDTPLNSCVGNPIDPTTGNKFQLEPVLQIEGVHSINFDLIYNSLRQEKWRHSYSQSVVSVSDTQTPVNANYQNLFCGSNTEILESPGGFGDAIVETTIAGSGVYFKPRYKPKVPQLVRNTAQEACEKNWKSQIGPSVSSQFHYSWVDGSTATYLGNGICSIKDSTGVERLKLNVYRSPFGMPVLDPIISCADLDPTVPPQLDSTSRINVRFTRNDGRLVRFIYNPITAELENQSHTGEKAEFIANGVIIAGYLFHTKNDEIEEYDEKGKLLSITAIDGHVQTLSYTVDAVTNETLLDRVENTTGEYIQFGYETVGTVNPFSRINAISDHSSRGWGFRYDVNDNLEYVDFPDTFSRQYHYEDPIKNDLLTGVTDEMGNRYASWTYNTDSKANLSAHGSDKNIDKRTVTYNENTNQHIVSKVRYSELNETSANINSTYYTHASGGSKVVAAITGNDDVKFEHNPITGYLEYKIEHGVRTEYSNYDTKGNPGTIIEASGTPDVRTTTYTYDPRYYDKVATITEASIYPGSNKVTTYLYDDFGNNTTITINGFKPDGTPVSRTTIFTYNGPYHQLTSIDGPRDNLSDANDVYTLMYYTDTVTEGSNRARLKSVTAPENIVLYSNITYTAAGKVHTYLDENNILVTFSYDPNNDRLLSLEQYDVSTIQRRFTEWTYLDTGEVEKIISGSDANDKSTLKFEYDEARRLVAVKNNLNQKIKYTLDSEGNVEKEVIKSSTGTLDIIEKQLTQTFDDYDRLQLRIQENEQYTEMWSPNGTLDKTIDGNNVTTDYTYDDLLRLTNTTQDFNGVIDPATANAVTNYGYDSQDNLISVTDANNGQTTYIYDDLGNLINTSSPDTGNRDYTHDDAGNVVTMTDAKLQFVSYTYDALNRLTNIDAPGTEDDVINTYDACIGGGGKLCSTQRNNSSTNYTYNMFGDPASINQNLITWSGGLSQADNTVGYEYDTAGRIKTMTYPSGAVITHGYDLSNNLVSIVLDQNGVTTPLAQARHMPFGGGVEHITYGNSLLMTKRFDLAYRSDVVLIQTDVYGTETRYLDYIVSFDGNGNAKLKLTLEDGLNLTQNYTYDAHNRLDTSIGYIGSFDYDYDLVGNRTQLLIDGITTSSTYEPQTNRMATLGTETINMDANGNTENLRGVNLTFTSDNRLKSVGSNASYQYNGLGQRTMKKVIAPGVAGVNGYSQTHSYLFGLNGELLAEMGPTGIVLKEYIYLDNELLAMLEHAPSSTEDFLAVDIDGDGTISREDVYVWLSNYYFLGDVSKDPNGDGVLNSTDIADMSICITTQNSCQASSYNTNIYYVHNDNLGTPKLLTNEAGAAVWHAVATPFGETTVNSDVDLDGTAVEMNVRFPGQYYDVESGLHQNYFRSYDPSIGRYLESDPIGALRDYSNPMFSVPIAMGLIDVFGDDESPINHLYNYVDNNPLNYFDPEGLAKKKYQKPVNPNQKKGAENRQQTGSRERNIGHPEGEEHSRRPKGGTRIPGIRGLICPLCPYVLPPERPSLPSC